MGLRSRMTFVTWKSGIICICYDRLVSTIIWTYNMDVCAGLVIVLWGYLTRNSVLTIISKATQKEVCDFLLTKCVWGIGMLQVVFNIKAWNYYSKSTFIVTLIKQEKLVFILVILCIREYLCVFTKLFTGSWNNRKYTALCFTVNNFAMRYKQNCSLCNNV